MSLIAIENVKKRFGANEVLKGIDLKVEAGEVIAIIGKSGSGKSTLLRCINGLESIDEGNITVAGAKLGSSELELRALRRKVGMIFQQFNLFPHLSAGRNVMLAPTVAAGVKEPEALTRARECLAKVALGEKFDSYPDQLSGGQQQRVAIAPAAASPARGRLPRVVVARRIAGRGSCGTCRQGPRARAVLVLAYRPRTWVCPSPA